MGKGNKENADYFRALSMEYAVRAKPSPGWKPPVNDPVIHRSRRNKKLGISNKKPRLKGANGARIKKAPKLSRKQQYDLYINSWAWKAKREELFRSRPRHCERCSYAGPVDVHHLHYENLGAEPLSDLQILCRECHEREHIVRPKNSFTNKKSYEKWLEGSIVTAKGIQASMTLAGGWTKETLAEWGIPWPPPKGWEKMLSNKNS